MTATRQYVAHNKKASQDELDQKISLWDNKEVDDDSFLINGLTIQGCKWVTDNLQTTQVLTNPVQTVKASWFKSDVKQREKLNEHEIFVPVYLNQTRKNLLFSVRQNCEGLAPNYLYQRGAGLVAWNM